VASASAERTASPASAVPDVGREDRVVSARADAAPAAEGAPDRKGLVLVADPVIEEGKATASALAAWGLQPILVHDGVEAILTIQRTLPRVAIIDAALPKMYGFQICELLKRNESLRDINVVLVGAVHDHNRYRRSPTELYGADAYLERPQLPDALWPILHGFGMPLAGGTPVPARPSESAAAFEEPPAPPAAPEAVVAPEPAPEPPPAVPPPVAAADPDFDAEIAKAERLARIVVSDIILYNQEKFEAAIQADNVLTAMDAELGEGRTLFAQRIDARVREARDFLTEELLRVAGMRRSQ
jgi:CheY-like chemotaxis protein